MTRYQVYGRKAYNEPLTLLAPLELADDAELKTQALDKYGDDWIELVAAREEDVTEVALKR
ncbi:hypothetical protein E5F05_00460 (plasmid) [Deinococcus metallilatus]|uniref:Uncharacterized protein n=1 Tax=Deinococcus metallilatus TaxID=1211322 RepID=A0AAJ5F5V1_9DEIO|nr:hypothetical protein [Deinococcus metallilatus]MBB5293370.1 hypothetical protein [Deinococcus metallilatus]QBY06472.1 hypothetical protein E5F05_00460 [Deinococcus metallilatus]RXJ17815.1 hypothetical protein ERJ73_00070 [Deinococcus metallilatus]TLK32087.1 hypothetical protein FCS05_01090 [Deinococcus metallilatus]GMA15407.1 hypothetical protein GCM10025871_17380 [Deinococcus metallilatus]